MWWKDEFWSFSSCVIFSVSLLDGSFLLCLTLESTRLIFAFTPEAPVGFFLEWWRPTFSSFFNLHETTTGSRNPGAFAEKRSRRQGKLQRVGESILFLSWCCHWGAVPIAFAPLIFFSRRLLPGSTSSSGSSLVVVRPSVRLWAESSVQAERFRALSDPLIELSRTGFCKLTVLFPNQEARMHRTLLTGFCSICGR